MGQGLFPFELLIEDQPITISLPDKPFLLPLGEVGTDTNGNSFPNIPEVGILYLNLYNGRNIRNMTT